MFIVNLRTFSAESAAVSIIGTINEIVRPLPALAQSINANSVTTVPASGVYYANVNGQNMDILAPCELNTVLTNPNFVANGSEFRFQAYDSSLRGENSTSNAPRGTAKPVVTPANQLKMVTDKVAKMMSEGKTEPEIEAYVASVVEKGIITQLQADALLVK